MKKRDRHFHLILSDQELDALRAVAERDGVSASAAARRLLRDGFANARTSMEGASN